MAQSMADPLAFGMPVEATENGSVTKRRTVKVKPRVRLAPQRLVEGDDFRVSKKNGLRIDVSEAGMARIVEEWLKGRTSILVIDGSDVVRIKGQTPV
jgi:hypothetical protein